jgi:C_GCAxxG_C_C family probable redox protein
MEYKRDICRIVFHAAGGDLVRKGVDDPVASGKSKSVTLMPKMHGSNGLAEVKRPLNADLVKAIGSRAKNLFATRQLECAEAVLTTLNRALAGGLPEATAVSLASGLCNGLGGSGCTCGALSGATVAVGLFLGRRGPGIGNGRKVRAAAANLHDAFRQRFGATCCRVLTRSTRVDSADHFRRCAERTGRAAELAAEAVLHHRPELADGADWGYLRTADSAMRGRLRRLCGAIAGTPPSA